MSQHENRAAFLIALIGSGIMAYHRERQLDTASKRRKPSPEDKKALHKVKRTIDFVHRVAAIFAAKGVDRIPKDLSKARWWPKAPLGAEIHRKLFGYLTYVPMARFNPAALDITTIDLRRLDVRTFEPKQYLL